MCLLNCPLTCVLKTSQSFLYFVTCNFVLSWTSRIQSTRSWTNILYAFLLHAQLPARVNEVSQCVIFTTPCLFIFSIFTETKIFEETFSEEQRAFCLGKIQGRFFLYNQTIKWERMEIWQGYPFTPPKYITSLLRFCRMWTVKHWNKQESLSDYSLFCHLLVFHYIWL